MILLKPPNLKQKVSFERSILLTFLPQIVALARPTLKLNIPKEPVGDTPARGLDGQLLLASQIEWAHSALDEVAPLLPQAKPIASTDGNSDDKNNKNYKPPKKSNTLD